MNPTDEQIAIVDFVKASSANLMIRALAGTGKTSTLDLIQAASPIKPILCLAFNKRIAEEMEKRFPSTTTVRTFNSLGHRIWAKSVTGIKLDPKKTDALFKERLQAYHGEDRKELREAYWDIIQATSMAKALGYCPGSTFNGKPLCSRDAFHEALEEELSPLVADFIDDILLDSIKASYKGLIDFNDQVYMPAVFGGSFPRFPFVLVDEYQDLNPVNHKMLEKLITGRVAGVGDPWQSIYGFRGATRAGMDLARSTFKMEEKDLSVSFRCPQAIVEAARWRVPHFKWVKEGGHVEILKTLDATAITDQNVAIICRNNAPLFHTAFQLLASGRSVSVAGSDIGPRLIRILKKLGDDFTTQDALLEKIEAWKAEKLKTTKATRTIEDMTACLRIFAAYGATLGQAVSYAEHLFKQQGTIRLLTGHKAKGLEWDTVYHLDPWLIGDDDDQELNLRYVIGTRSKQNLYEIDSRNIKW